MDHNTDPLDIIIIGASGDLTRKKLVPALFTLFSAGMLPDDFSLYGTARSDMNDETFRDRLKGTLVCRHPGGNCDTPAKDFLRRCFYHSGGYDSTEDFGALHSRIRKERKGSGADRLIYMAVPPDVFRKAAETVKSSGMADPDEGRWARVIMEKPFGRDSRSSSKLAELLSSLFDREQLYRIDHYLGKEVIQNLLILRFANLIFEPLWNRNYIDRVTITFAETIGIEGRGGYFDGIGIIRDVIQNHLLQILALAAMDEPVSLASEHIADAKTRLLESVAPVTVGDIVLGQYEGYGNEKGVKPGSRTETFARIDIRIENSRWFGVPFTLSAGKGVDSQKTEIRIFFKPLPFSVFRRYGSEVNELVIRVQPDEAVELCINNKVPGLTPNLQRVKLDMLYREAFEGELPEAYERLLLDVIRGDRSLFIHEGELAAAWNIVTPLLHELEEKKISPKPYGTGSRGPEPGA